MSEAVARQKLSCPSCGGETQWNPAKQALVCPFCGATSPAPAPAGPDGQQTVPEHDLAAALRGIPDDCRGWQAEKITVRCQTCQAISVFEPARVSQRCDFCGATALVPYTEIKEAFRPESLLPMKLAETQIRDRIRDWYRSRWFAPNKLRDRAMTDTVKGIYIPYWTFDAQAHANWTADSGYHYYESESYRDADGKTQTRQVQKTRWVPSAGAVDHFFDDELVPASRGVQEEMLRGVEPFPTRDLVPYDPSFLSGWVVERYQIDLLAAARRSREQMEQKLCGLCEEQVPGDTHRNLRVQSNYTQQTFKHILVPIWLLTYDFGARAYQVVINGYTGQIKGRYPKSWIKITLFILTMLAIVGVIVLVTRR